MPDISSIDSEALISLQPLIKQRISIWADALNLLALRTTTAVIERDGRTFGQVAGRMPTLRLRVGLRYLF